MAVAKAARAATGLVARIGGEHRRAARRRRAGRNWPLVCGWLLAADRAGLPRRAAAHALRSDRSGYRSIQGAPPFSPGHLLGTDAPFGRDVLSRLLYGGRVDLLIGFGGTGVTVIVGTLVGLLAGYFGGRLDACSCASSTSSSPSPSWCWCWRSWPCSAPACSTSSSPSGRSAGSPTRGSSAARRWWPRSRSMCWRRARSATATLRIMVRHILPNVFSAALIFSMADAVGNILLGAALGYLGLGVPPPDAGMGHHDRRLARTIW